MPGFLHARNIIKLIRSGIVEAMRNNTENYCRPSKPPPSIRMSDSGRIRGWMSTGSERLEGGYTGSMMED